MDLWIGCAVIGFRVVFLVPHADSDCIRSVRGNQDQFVLEAFLLLQQRQDFVLKRLVKRCNTIRLQTHGNTTSEHVNLLSCGGYLRGPFQTTCLVQMIWRVGKRAQSLTRLGSLPSLVKDQCDPTDAPQRGEVCEP